MNGTLLLTGGTGSFGSAFIRYCLDSQDIAAIRIYSRDEHKQARLRAAIKSDRVAYFIGDVRDKGRLRRVMQGCDMVVHAAALKQAPIGEIEGQEFIKTNILGSMNVVETALDCYISKALLLSTDKAVFPINLYGATKMCAERLFLQANAMRGEKNTAFSVVRYGNVAGTAGSLIPQLLALANNEPSIIYDQQATRFWITLDQACVFVFEKLSTARGGELFIPELPSVRILDVIKAVRPGKEILVKGARIGDKRHEILSYDPVSGAVRSSNDNRFLTVEEIRNDVFGRNHEFASK